MTHFNLSTDNSSDEDDEFGGGRLTKELIYGKRLRVPANDAITMPDESTVEVDDEDDEFGGGRVMLTSYPLFSSPPLNNSYLVDTDDLRGWIKPGENINFPQPGDSEFQTFSPPKILKQQKRTGLTTQLCGYHDDAPEVIFAHPEKAANINVLTINPYPIIKSEYHPIDYLNHLGLNVDLYHSTTLETDGLPKLFSTIYAHFATAELNMFASGKVKEILKKLQRTTDKHKPRIEMGRRVRCVTPVDGIELDWVELSHVIVINGYKYSLCLRIIDTCAIHGIGTYLDVCKAVGIDLLFKNNFTSQEKGNMLDMIITRPEDFRNYALGDLKVAKILIHFTEKMREIYKLLGLEKYYREPKLTIGGTVKDLFEATLAEFLGLPKELKPGTDFEKTWKNELKEIIDRFIKDATAGELRQFTTWTRGLIAKVEGGRCRNNQPLVVYIPRKLKGGKDWGLIGDIDISGCYGEGQRNQIYPIGIPEIWDYKATVKNNKYVTLREWLEAYDVPVEQIIQGDKSNWGELVAGLWQARIRTTKKLKYGQDFFASWFTESSWRENVMAKYINKMACDSELESKEWVDFDEETGNLKIFNHDILNGVITHDGLQWILFTASKRQRNELLDNIVVLASAVYPKSQQIVSDKESIKEQARESLDILKKEASEWTGVNTTERITGKRGCKIIQMQFDEYHGWFGINLGELLVDQLLIQRKIAQKVTGKKSPLDTLFKLCINTLYGDMVSKFFLTSNTTVGNNITARARALAWYMEKGFHGIPTITDGCPFELNGVLYPGRDSINGECINLHRPDSKLATRMIRRAPLGNAKEILGKFSTYLEYDEDKPEGKTVDYVTLIVDGEEFTPVIKENEKHPGFYYLESNPGIDWIDKKAMEHLITLFPLVDIFSETTSLIKVKDQKADGDWNIQYLSRQGQFTFETKNVYCGASFHGSSNYAFFHPTDKNDDKLSVLKCRGYQTTKEHEGYAESDEEEFKKISRYGEKTNPAKDFLTQLYTNPNNVIRQNVAIKQTILMIGAYKERSESYDEMEIEPGDNVKTAFLMQEFSLTQFTYQTYDQYISWMKEIEKLKLKNKQSIESYFLNEDKTLNMVKMVHAVEEMIMTGVMEPIKHLDPSKNRQRATQRTNEQLRADITNINIVHPHADEWEKVRDGLGEGEIRLD